MKKLNCAFLIMILIALNGCSSSETYDILIKNGKIIDGTGRTGFIGNIGINADTIAAIGKLENAKGKQEIDAEGYVVSPGFINMLSWAGETLIADGRSQSDIRQGVTLEVMGEGWSMGPLNDKLKEEKIKEQDKIKYDVCWTTLGEYLDYLEKKGVSTNIASFVGATTLRKYTVGYEDRIATKEELDTMTALVKQAMEEGAVGVSTSLPYVPAAFSTTEEIIALCKAAAEYDGMYISHIRNEGEKLLESLNEFIKIAKEANIRSEIYHLKQAGKPNWNKYDSMIHIINSVRAAGLQITADMYTYNASATGLNAVLPAWVKEGGFGKSRERLQDPVIRKKVLDEIIVKTEGKKGLRNVPFEGILLIDFKNDSLKYLSGKTLSEVAKMRNTPPEETLLDLIVQDSSSIGTIYFSMSEENVKKQVALPWVSFCSDAGSYSAEGVFLEMGTHPRAYGSFIRVLGKYVRDEKVISMEEAIRKLSWLPATNLKIKKRGALKKGFFADIVVFDPEKVQDNATFDNPHQYATGVIHVFVNGTQVLKNGEHTGALPGRFVKGPGWKQN